MSPHTTPSTPPLHLIFVRSLVVIRSRFTLPPSFYHKKTKRATRFLDSKKKMSQSTLFEKKKVFCFFLFLFSRDQSLFLSNLVSFRAKRNSRGQGFFFQGSPALSCSASFALLPQCSSWRRGSSSARGTVRFAFISQRERKGAASIFCPLPRFPRALRDGQKNSFFSLQKQNRLSPLQNTQPPSTPRGACSGLSPQPQ